MSPRKAGKEDVAAAKRAVKDAKAAAKAADKEAKAAAKRARKSKRAAARPGHQGGRYVPIEKRLRNQQRERAAGEAAAERARRAAKDVYRLIGFDALYADGIAQVEPGLFSQTVSFGDISYQSMGDESQKSVCRQMRKLYDGLTPDVGLQLLLFNRPLTKGEMSNRRFFGRVEGPAAPYAAEYSRILNDKMAEGVSNIMRERYLTFSVSADTVEESVPKLARLRSMADGVLSGMRSGARVLRGEERLQLIRSMTRPGRERAEFGYDELAVTRGITAKDLACPDTMEFKPGGSASCFTSDGVWCQVLAFRSFESNLTDRCLAGMVDLPMPLAISFHVKAMNPRWSKDYVRRRLKWIDKEMSEDQMDAVSKGYDFNLIPSELKFTREEAQDVYECLKGDSQRMFRYTGLVFTYAPTREELDEQAMHLISVAQAQGIELANLDYRQREGLNSVLPLGRNHVKVGRLMLTDEIAIQSPFATLELNDFGGGYYGQNKGSRNLVMLNRKGLASRNGIISGMPGSGKSFGAKREMTNTALLYPEDDVVIIDPAGEFGLLAEAFGGRNVAFGPDSETYLNPLDLSDVSELLETTQLACKIEAVLALSAASMAEGNEGLSDVERSIISRCVEKAYLTCGRSGAVPQLQDLYDILRQQPEPEAEIVALRFERYVSGALSIFNHQSNVAFDRRITCVGLKDLPDNMRAFGIIAVLEAVRNRMYANFERGVTTWLYIDEVQSLFGHPATISYFSRFWAEGRKFNLICTGITQNRLPHAAQAVVRRQGQVVGAAEPLGAGGGLHRRVGQPRRRPAHSGRVPRAHRGRLPQGRALRPVQHQARRDRRAQARRLLRQARGGVCGRRRRGRGGWRCRVGGPTPAGRASPARSRWRPATPGSRAVAAARSRGPTKAPSPRAARTALAERPMAPPTPPRPKAGSPAGPGAPSRPASSGSSTTATSSPGPKAPTAQAGLLRTFGSGAGQGPGPTRSPLWRMPPTTSRPSRQRRRSASPGKPGPLPGRAVRQKARPARNPCWQGPRRALAARPPADLPPPAGRPPAPTPWARPRPRPTTPGRAPPCRPPRRCPPQRRPGPAVSSRRPSRRPRPFWAGSWRASPPS